MDMKLNYYYEICRTRHLIHPDYFAVYWDVDDIFKLKFVKICTLLGFKF